MVPDWSDRYPLIAAEAARLKGSAILDAEVVCASKDGVPDFDALHSRTNDHVAVACLSICSRSIATICGANRLPDASFIGLARQKAGSRSKTRKPRGHAGTLTCCVKATILRKP